MMFRYTLRDESNHIELFRRLLLELVDENPEIWTPAFREELRGADGRGGRAREALHPRLPAGAARSACRPTEFEGYIDYIADRRLEGVGLEPLAGATENPLPWLAELMDIRKEQNFFEGRVTEYQKASVPRARRRRRALDLPKGTRP